MQLNRPSLIAILLLASISQPRADFWSDSGDSASSDDIDSGARSETTTDQDLVNDAQGPGQPQDTQQSQVPTLYDPWGRPYVYGMPYGYGAGMGYGMGYFAGPYGGGAGPGRR